MNIDSLYIPCEIITVSPFSITSAALPIVAKGQLAEPELSSLPLALLT